MNILREKDTDTRPIAQRGGAKFKTIRSIFIHAVILSIAFISIQCQDFTTVTNNDIVDEGDSTPKAMSVSMAWVSMREGLLQIQGGTGTLGVIVSRQPVAPDYDSVKNLPGFYTRLLNGNNRTVYLSITDKMQQSDFTSGMKTIDGSGTSFVPTSDAPEMLHPDTDYTVYLYDIDKARAIDTTVPFKTNSFPASFPTEPNSMWSDVYNHMENGPVIETKAGEYILFPLRFRLMVEADGFGDQLYFPGENQVGSLMFILPDGNSFQWFQSLGSSSHWDFRNMHSGGPGNGSWESLRLADMMAANIVGSGFPEKVAITSFDPDINIAFFDDENQIRRVTQ